jgi:benzoyl-CoA reductase subunit B
MNMSETQRPDGIVGRGNREGAQLFREWFGLLDETAQNNGPSAYVFVMGSMAEILQTFDLPMVFPEINSLQTAVRRVAHEYLGEAEDYGYSPDICGYVKADVALQLRGGDHPMGNIPKPTLAVLTNACNTYIKWAEIWERMYGVHAFVLDIPGTRSAGTQTWPGDPGFERDRRYVQAQVQELIGVCEELTGKKFDIDRLREVLGYTNRMNTAWKKILELNKSHPSLFNALTDEAGRRDGIQSCQRHWNTDG